MHDIMKKYERVIIGILIFLMAVIVLLSTVELCWIIIEDIITPPVGLISSEELLEVFGFFLLVLIGIELIDTIRSYLTDHIVRAEVVVEVAVIAIARKIIILDMKEYPSLTLVGIAAMLLALTAGFYVLNRWRCGKNM